MGKVGEEGMGSTTCCPRRRDPMPLPVLGDGVFLGTVDFCLEDFEMHCYCKGNLGNPTQTSPLPWENHRKRKKRAGPQGQQGWGQQCPLTALTNGMPKCCRPAHRLCSQRDCPLQALSLCRAQPVLTPEVRGAPANPSVAAAAHKTLLKCYQLLAAPGWPHSLQGDTSILCRAFQYAKGSFGPHLPCRVSLHF